MDCKEYREEDHLQLSGIQHFLFCRRQWALIHVENLWAENYWTVDGKLMHERAHAPGLRERRGDLLTVRAMRVRSMKLGLSGECDVVEFHRDEERGVSLSGVDGRWIPYPVEYKRGRSKVGDSDRAQLCAQAMCLEEMLCCDIAEGAMYYGSVKRREVVPLTEELRGTVREAVKEMHALAERGWTPKARKSSKCDACSLSDQCMPEMFGHAKVDTYLRRALSEGEI